MTGPLFRRVVLAALVAVPWATAPSLALARQPEAARPGSADVTRRREELREAIVRLGENARTLPGPLARLGYALLDDGRYEEAEQVFRRQIAVAQTHFPGETVEVAFPLHHLGERYRYQRHCNEALPLYQQALAIQEKRTGPDHVDIARSLHRIGSCQSQIYRFAEADAALTAALAMMERVSGIESADAATVANDLGDHYMRMGCNGDAIAVLRRAASSREQLFSANDTRPLSPLSRLGYAYIEDSRFADADWVILSACNTAVAPGVPRSEAHRRAMLALAADAGNPHYAHPMFWAPFVVVGEGGPSARQ